MTAADVVDNIITRVKNAGADTYIRGKCDYTHMDKIYDPEDLLGIAGRSRLFIVTTDGSFSLAGPIGTITEWTEIEATNSVIVVYELGSSVKAVTKAVMEDRDRLSYHLTRADYYPTGVSRRIVESAGFISEGQSGGAGLLELVVSTLYQPTFT